MPLCWNQAGQIDFRELQNCRMGQPVSVGLVDFMLVDFSTTSDLQVQALTQATALRSTAGHDTAGNGARRAPLEDITAMMLRPVMATVVHVGARNILRGYSQSTCQSPVWPKPFARGTWT